MRRTNQYWALATCVALGVVVWLYTDSWALAALALVAFVVIWLLARTLGGRKASAHAASNGRAKPNGRDASVVIYGTFGLGLAVSAILARPALDHLGRALAPIDDTFELMVYFVIGPIVILVSGFVLFGLGVFVGTLACGREAVDSWMAQEEQEEGKPNWLFRRMFGAADRFATRRDRD